MAVQNLNHPPFIVFILAANFAHATELQARQTSTVPILVT
jgi:hypothetical protein